MSYDPRSINMFGLGLTFEAKMGIFDLRESGATMVLSLENKRDQSLSVSLLAVSHQAPAYEISLWYLIAKSMSGSPRTGVGTGSRVPKGFSLSKLLCAL